MEVLNDNAGHLSNYEVLVVMKEVNKELATIKNKFSDSQKVNVFRNGEIVEEHLSNSPCAQQSTEKIKLFLQALSQFKLKQTEKLQILNSCPAKPVDLHILVEECDSRFSDEEVDSILTLVQTHLCQDVEMSEGGEERETQDAD